jgi:transposase
MAGGRPTKYQPEICEKVIELMKGGASRHTVALELEIDYQTLLNWEEKHKEFFDALKIGTSLSRGWWEKKAQESIADKDINATILIFNLKNRFREAWNDTQKQVIDSKSEVNVKGEVRVDNLDERIKELTEK